MRECSADRSEHTGRDGVREILYKHGECAHAIEYMDACANPPDIDTQHPVRAPRTVAVIHSCTRVEPDTGESEQKKEVFKQRYS